MRTKTLLLTAALSAAGVATSMAQAVYSVNAVGYVNTPLTAGKFNLVSNPLDSSSDVITNLFAALPNNSTVFKYVNGQYTSYLKVSPTTWLPAAAGTVEVNPGEGVFVRVGGTANVTVTFVGEVRQGALSHPVPQGFSIQSSEVPQTGGLQTTLGFTPVSGDTVFQFDPDAGYTSKLFQTGPGWLGGEPQIGVNPKVGVGEAFFVRRTGAAGAWTRNFTVN
jgi:hypothetical protein